MLQSYFTPFVPFYERLLNLLRNNSLYGVCKYKMIVTGKNGDINAKNKGSRN